MVAPFAPGETVELRPYLLSEQTLLIARQDSLVLETLSALGANPRLVAKAAMGARLSEGEKSSGVSFAPKPSGQRRANLVAVR